MLSSPSPEGCPGSALRRIKSSRALSALWAAKRQASSRRAISARIAFQSVVSVKSISISLNCVGVCVPLNFRIHKSISELLRLYSCRPASSACSTFSCRPSKRFKRSLASANRAMHVCVSCCVLRINALRRASNSAGVSLPTSLRISSCISDNSLRCVESSLTVSSN